MKKHRHIFSLSALAALIIITNLLTGITAWAQTAKSKQVSFELWPGGRRLNNTVYLLGKEYNHLYFKFSANKRELAKHKFKLPTTLTKSITLELDYPENVKYKGSAGRGLTESVAKALITHNGQQYKRYILKLPLDKPYGLITRLIKKDYYYEITSFIIPPAKLQAKIYWQIKYGDKVLKKGNSNLATTGIITPGAKLPKHFSYGFSGGANVWSFPDKYDKLISLYRRLGITEVDVLYFLGQNRVSGGKKRFYEASKKLGLGIGILRGGSFMEYIYCAPKKYGSKGLIWGAKKEAALYNNKKDRDALKAIAPYATAYIYDYEPMYGPHTHPGYNDKPTIAAFAQKYGIKEPLTQKLLKTKYRKKYSQYREELLSLPIKALRELVRSVKPLPIYLEQGSGVGAHLDYKIYDKYVDYHCPMFYTPSLIDYYSKVSEIAEYISPKKLVPDSTYGYSTTGICRQTPAAVMLDIVGVAASGAVGSRVWPGLRTIDEGLLYGAWQGLQMIAEAEDFYSQGVQTKAITVKGLPFKTKIIKAGSRVIDLSSPDWGSNLRYRIHKLNNDYMITLLNFSKTNDAYVELSGKLLQGRLLVNPFTKEYLTIDGAKAMVKVAKGRPAIWRVTDSKLAATTAINASDLFNEFQRKKSAFNRNSSGDNVQLGKKGDIEITYTTVEVAGQKKVCLAVITPKQQIAFNESGGRIFSWQVDGNELVAVKKLSQGGFAMDLLWLPSPARWSGDEIAVMQLVSCKNSGSVATIVYRGEFKNGMPGIKLEKTFTVDANAKTINVTLRIINSQALPVTMSYWSHNTMAMAATGIAYLKNGKVLQHDSTGGTTIFPNSRLPKNEKKYVYNPKKIIASIDNVYAELLENSKNALVVRLPVNFMNVYRYKRGTEWMGRPITIQATSTAIINYSLNIVPKDKLKAVLPNLGSTKLKAAPATTEISKPTNQPISDANLMPQYSAKNRAKFPDGYFAKTSSKANLELLANGILKFTGKPKTKFQIQLAKPLKLAKDKKYLFSIELKVDKMQFTGNWYRQLAGLWIYIYGKNGRNKWMVVSGNGSSKGWVTVMFPFDTIGSKNANLTTCNVWLRINNTAGTVYARNPLLIEREANDEMTKHFITADGQKVVNSRFIPKN